MRPFLRNLKIINQLPYHQTNLTHATVAQNPIASPKWPQSSVRWIGAIVASTLLLPQSFITLPPVQANQTGICAVPGKDGTATVSGIVNSYYPGSGTVAVGSTSVTVGSINPNGNTTPIAKGDLLLIIQMQDADIDSSNTDAYGNGVAGDVNASTAIVPPPLGASGYTNLNNAGRYEYAVAAGPISGGIIPLTKGTIYSYRTAAAAGSSGKRSFQVVRVPQYTSATITGTLTTAAQWNGGSGGIVAIDVKGSLNFTAGSTIDVNGLGFRGGGSNPNPATSGATSTFRTTSQGSLVGIDAPKGEGIAGTPRFVARQPFGSFNVRNTTATDDLGASGYPNGDEGRGAPANAGGGGNEHNAGGGGGANGGAGGLGGRSYANAQTGNGTPPRHDATVGGFGGTAMPVDPTRLVFGGGGGAGDTNNQTRPAGAGGGGGGIVLVRAGSITGSGTINARGADGIDSPQGALPDAGGGGGAGGTVLVTTQTGTASGLTIVATGGIGGDLNENGTTETDGPGAGGGGGSVYTTGGASVNVAGGAAGLIVNGLVRNNTSNDATAGMTGINQTITSSNLTTSISGSDPSCSVTISGQVFNDGDGNKVLNGSEIGVNAGSLTAVLVDSNNKVIAKTTIATTGNYSFSNVSANSNYTVLITTATATIGAAPPAITLPNNWLSTGENLNGSIDGTIDSQQTISVAISNVTGVNFGIEQRPTAIGHTVENVFNPGGTNKAVVPAALFTNSTDPDGTIAAYHLTAFPTNSTSLVIDGTTYTALNFPVGGVTVSSDKLNTVQVDPIDGAVNVEFSFTAIDNAGQESINTALSTLPFLPTPVTLSGTVFNDANGSKLQDGTETGTNAGGLNAVLLDSANTVVATTIVAADGTYTFNNVITNSIYTIQLTTESISTGSAAPAVTLPSNWVVMGENFSGTIDFIPDGKLTVNVNTSDVNQLNFGIEQLPTAVGKVALIQINPGDTNSVAIPPTLFTESTDSDGSIAAYKITAFPTNTTSLTIDNTTYTAATFPSGGITVPVAQLNTLQVDPIDGVVNVEITFQAIDNAGQTSTNTASFTMPFNLTGNSLPRLLMVKRITAINGVPITFFDDDIVSISQAEDNHPNWPAPLNTNSSAGSTNLSTFLSGKIDAGLVKPGDDVEYTIYFLSAGDVPIRNLNFCDLVPTHMTFQPNSFGSGQGIQLSLGGNLLNLTNVPDSDRAEFLNPGAQLPNYCPSSGNPMGAVLVNIVNSSFAAPDNELPNATAPGTPTNSSGFVRFRAKVN
ncbi:MAG: hypothetical protein B0A82_03945 [Alkalinema sp. CACIAM 70d]|nr:MAG: hypothetical protein B0A82_03945 [Alkalinema sp. CACIAM 70d]